MPIKQIPYFDKLNNVSIIIYILQKNKKTFKTLIASLTKQKREKLVNHLLVQDRYDDNQEPIKYHYAWIKNLSILLSKQLSSHNGNEHFCDRCLDDLRSPEDLGKHVEDCMLINKTVI